MKYAFFITILLVLLISCKPSGTKEVTSEQGIITSTDSSAIAPEVDSLNINPETNETTMQQDPPSTGNATPTSDELKSTPVKICDPAFKSLAVPRKNHQVIYVSGFKASEFKCWSLLEENGVKECGGNSCVIYYVDVADVKINSTGPDYMDPNTLMLNGVARFEFKSNYWELKGASIWKRKGSDYTYYNSSQY